MDKIRVGAKLNLSLRVTGKRGGMHTLDMRVCSVSLYDEVRLLPANGKENIRERISVTSSLDGFDPERFMSVPEKALALFEEKYGKTDCAFSIVKGIPSGAGMGGSSAAIAGMVRLLAEKTGITPDVGFLLSLGSDVPYIYTGGEARVRGTGEDVEKLPYKKRYAVILIAEGGVDTARAYALYDEMQNRGEADSKGACGLVHNADGAESANAADSADSEKMADGADESALYANDLYAPAIKLNPLVAKAADTLCAAGAENVVMTGSGSGVCAFFDDEESARRVYSRLQSGERVYFLDTIRGF